MSSTVSNGLVKEKEGDKWAFSREPKDAGPPGGTIDSSPSKGGVIHAPPKTFDAQEGSHFVESNTASIAEDDDADAYTEEVIDTDDEYFDVSVDTNDYQSVDNGMCLNEEVVEDDDFYRENEVSIEMFIESAIETVGNEATSQDGSKRDEQAEDATKDHIVEGLVKGDEVGANAEPTCFAKSDCIVHRSSKPEDPAEKGQDEEEKKTPKEASVASGDMVLVGDGDHPTKSEDLEERSENMEEPTEMIEAQKGETKKDSDDSQVAACNDVFASEPKVVDDKSSNKSSREDEHLDDANVDEVVIESDDSLEAACYDVVVKPKDVDDTTSNKSSREDEPLDDSNVEEVVIESELEEETSFEQGSVGKEGSEKHIDDNCTHKFESILRKGAVGAEAGPCEEKAESEDKCTVSVLVKDDSSKSTSQPVNIGNKLMEETEISEAELSVTEEQGPQIEVSEAAVGASGTDEDRDELEEEKTLTESKDALHDVVFSEETPGPVDLQQDTEPLVEEDPSSAPSETRELSDVVPAGAGEALTIPDPAHTVSENINGDIDASVNKMPYDSEKKASDSALPDPHTFVEETPVVQKQDAISKEARDDVGVDAENSQQGIKTAVSDSYRSSVERNVEERTTDKLVAHLQEAEDDESGPAMQEAKSVQDTNQSEYDPKMEVSPDTSVTQKGSNSDNDVDSAENVDQTLGAKRDDLDVAAESRIEEESTEEPKSENDLGSTICDRVPSTASDTDRECYEADNSKNCADPIAIVGGGDLPEVAQAVPDNNGCSATEYLVKVEYRTHEHLLDKSEGGPKCENTSTAAVLDQVPDTNSLENSALYDGCDITGESEVENRDKREFSTESRTEFASGNTMEDLECKDKLEPTLDPFLAVEPIEELKDEPKEEPKLMEEPNEETNAELENYPKEGPPKHHPLEDQKEQPKEEPNEEPKEEPKEELSEQPKEQPMEEPTKKPKEKPAKEPKNEPQEEPPKHHPSGEFERKEHLEPPVDISRAPNLTTNEDENSIDGEDPRENHESNTSTTDAPIEASDKQVDVPTELECDNQTEGQVEGEPKLETDIELTTDGSKTANASNIHDESGRKNRSEKMASSTCDDKVLETRSDAEDARVGGVAEDNSSTLSVKHDTRTDNTDHQDSEHFAEDMFEVEKTMELADDEEIRGIEEDVEPVKREVEMVEVVEFEEEITSGVSVCGSAAGVPPEVSATRAISAAEPADEPLNDFEPSSETMPPSGKGSIEPENEHALTKTDLDKGELVLMSSESLLATYGENNAQASPGAANHCQEALDSNTLTGKEWTGEALEFDEREVVEDNAAVEGGSIKESIDIGGDEMIDTSTTADENLIKEKNIVVENNKIDVDAPADEELAKEASPRTTTREAVVMATTATPQEPNDEVNETPAKNENESEKTENTGSSNIAAVDEVVPQEAESNMSGDLAACSKTDTNAAPADSTTTSGVASELEIKPTDTEEKINVLQAVTSAEEDTKESSSREAFPREVSSTPNTIAEDQKESSPVAKEIVKEETEKEPTTEKESWTSKSDEMHSWALGGLEKTKKELEETKKLLTATLNEKEEAQAQLKELKAMFDASNRRNAESTTKTISQNAPTTTSAPASRDTMLGLSQMKGSVRRESITSLEDEATQQTSTKDILRHVSGFNDFERDESSFAEKEGGTDGSVFTPRNPASASLEHSAVSRPSTSVSKPSWTQSKPALKRVEISKPQAKAVRDTPQEPTTPVWARVKLRPTKLGQKIKEGGNMQGPITHIQKNTSADFNAEAVPTLLKPTPLGSAAKLGRNLAKPITHVQKDLMGDINFEANPDFILRQTEFGQKVKTGNDLQKPITHAEKATADVNFDANPSLVLKPTELGKKIKETGCLAGPVTHVQKNTSVDFNPEANPMILRSTNLGSSIRTGKDLAKPVTHIEKDLMGDINFEANPAFVLKSSSVGDAIKSGKDLQKPITRVEKAETGVNFDANPSMVLRPTELGKKAKKVGNLQAPITHVQKNTSVDFNPEANPTILRPTTQGSSIRVGKDLAKPVTHVEKDIMGDINFEANPAFVLRASSHGAVIKSGKDLQKPITHVQTRDGINFDANPSLVLDGSVVSNEETLSPNLFEQDQASVSKEDESASWEERMFPSA